MRCSMRLRGWAVGTPEVNPDFQGIARRRDGKPSLGNSGAGLGFESGYAPVPG